MGKTVRDIAISAKEAYLQMAAMENEKKNNALLAVADALENSADIIIEANIADVEAARDTSLALPLLKRLVFDNKKIADVVKGIRDLTKLPDPVGLTTYAMELDNGLNLYRVTSPIGVIGVIFESRPDALIQIATLALKSSNAVIMKGGSEAARTNRILANIINNAATDNGIPEGLISLLNDRNEVGELLKMDGFVDLIIPRGSNEFVKMIMDNTVIPVLGHADGVCHTYIDVDADLSQAVKVCLDAKTQYPSACNTTETILVHRSLAQVFLPLLNMELKNVNTEIFGCDETVKIIDCDMVKDWHTEYLDYKVSVKIVGSVIEAASHINRFGSGHTDAILTSNEDSAKLFMSLVDSANVFWNCSTRFSDGFRYGFGAEVGISTSKIHARGPVGLDGLVTYKYRLFGNGQIVGDYSSGKSAFTHRLVDGSCPFDR